MNVDTDAALTIPSGDIKPRNMTGAKTAANSALWIVAILGVGALLRFALISKESLWVDEIASWWFATDIGRALAGERTNPPLYYVLLHYWIACFGTTEAALRSLSVLPGIASIALVYQLGKRLFSRAVALGASFYQCVSSFQIYYSQEARCFALLVFLLLSAGLCLWRGLEEPGKRTRLRWLGGFVVAATLGLYTHFIAIFFLAGFGAFVFLRRRKSVLPFLAAAGIIFLSFLPWLITMLKAAAGTGQHRRHLFLKFPQAYWSFMFGDTLVPLDGEAVTHIRATLTHYALPLILAVFCVVALLPFVIRAARRWKDGFSFAFIVATVPVLLAFAVSFKVMLFDERYLIAASPFLYMVIAAGVMELYRWQQENRGWRWVVGTLIVGTYSALLLTSLSNYYFNPRFGREEWRQVTAYVESPEGGKSVIIFDPHYLRFGYDYYQRHSLPYLSFGDDPHQPSTSSSAEIAAAVQGYDRIWLVRSHTDSISVKEALDSSFPKQSVRVFPKGEGIEVSLYRGAKK